MSGKGVGKGGLPIIPDGHDREEVASGMAGAEVGSRSPEVWFAAGLRFTCTRCGRCCGGAPGHVWVSGAELGRIAAHRGVDVSVVRDRYTEWVVGRGRSLVDREGTHDCVFYDRASGCTIYPVRPRQCRTWPFWKENLRSPEAWARASADCPGMDQGRRHAREEIETALVEDGIAPDGGH